MSSVLWFFLILSWTGDVTIRHGYSTEQACFNKRQELERTLTTRVRYISDCVGLPIP